MSPRRKKPENLRRKYTLQLRINDFEDAHLRKKAKDLGFIKDNGDSDLAATMRYLLFADDV